MRVKFFLGFAILSILAYKVGFHKIYQNMATINLWYLSPAVITFLCIFLINALNLKILLGPIMDISFRRILKYHCYSWSLGAFTPAKMGELSMLYFLNMENQKFGGTAAVVALERLITLATLWIFALYGFSIFLKANTMQFAIISIFIWAGLFFFIFSSIGRTVIRRFVLRKYEVIFAGFSDTLQNYIKKNRILLLASFVMVTSRWTFFAMASYILFLSFQQNVNFFDLFLITVMSIIIGAIPITINGLGIREGMFVYLATKIEIPAPTALGVAATFLMITYTIALIFNSLLLNRYGFEIKGLLK